MLSAPVHQRLSPLQMRMFHRLCIIKELRESVHMQEHTVHKTHKHRCSPLCCSNILHILAANGFSKVLRRERARAETKRRRCRWWREGKASGRVHILGPWSWESRGGLRPQACVLGRPSDSTAAGNLLVGVYFPQSHSLPSVVRPPSSRANTLSGSVHVNAAGRWSLRVCVCVCV